MLTKSILKNLITVPAILFCCLSFTSCARTVYIQPHVAPIALIKPVGDEAGIYISPADLKKIHTQSSFFGGNIRVPLGTALKNASQEAFAPFFKRIFYVGTNDPTVSPYIIEVGMSSFNVTGGLDTRLGITCKVSNNGKTIFSGDFEGRGSGTAAAGFLSEALAREQIVKSAEEAFENAFIKVQQSFKDEIE